MSGDAKAAVGKRRRTTDAWVMDVVGREWCGNSHPPKDHRTLRVKDRGVERVFCALNDGFDIGIGVPDEWHVIMSRRAARSFSWWLFRCWAADLAGLRSAIYYKALGHRVRRYERAAKS